MNPRCLSFTVAAIVLSAVLGISHGHAADQANGQSNIFMYPKPYQMGDLVLKDVQGRTVSLSEFKGKVVLLHFWMIQCPACKIEEPMLEKLKAAYGPSGLEILAINLVDPPVAVAGHAANRRMPFQVLCDGGQGFSLRMVSMAGRRTSFLVNPGQEAILEVPGFPTTYILDCRGSAVGYSVGPAQWEDTFATSLLKSLIAQRKTCNQPQRIPAPRVSLLQ
jgi:thiol-disulfide isomerase/thioredoxin